MKKLRIFIREITGSIVRQFYRNNGFVLAGALSFFTLISMIPLGILVTALIRLFLPAEYVPILLKLLSVFIPEQMHREFQQNLPALLDLTLGFSISLLFQSTVAVLFLIWFGSLIFDIIERTLSVTFQVKRSRNFWHSKLTHILLMLTLGALYVLLSALAALFQILTRTVEAHISPDYIWLLSQPVRLLLQPSLQLLFASGIFFIIYYWSTPKKLHKRSYIKGAIAASVFWVAARYIFGLYLERINDFSLFFGALAVMARVAIWVLYSAVIFIIGAEIAWFMENRDFPPPEKTPAEMKPLPVTVKKVLSRGEKSNTKKKTVKRK